jgi:hypothetical protein
MGRGRQPLGRYPRDINQPRREALAPLLGQAMRTLSDMPRDIDAIRVIDHGQHTVCASNIQRVISPTWDKARAITPGNLAHSQARLPALRQNGKPNQSSDLPQACDAEQMPHCSRHKTTTDTGMNCEQSGLRCSAALHAIPQVS